MTFLLGTQNVFEYLIERGLCQPEEQYNSQIEPKICKNFNLLVRLPSDRHLLLKQEPHDCEGKTDGELLSEWQIHEFIRTFPELNQIHSLISEAVDFDASHAIIAFNYLNHYGDLDDFYHERSIFPTAIAASIGASLAAIHRTTFNSQTYKDFLSANCERIDEIPDFLEGLAEIEPEAFGKVSLDGFKFLELYQRYENLEEAIAELNAAFFPCCLTHNDLKLNNILLHNEWQKNTRIRFIDWERWAWGDPAFDLGTIIASYLKIWLSSLTINSDIDLEIALHLATTPLEQLQPSIATLTRTYCDRFPEILATRPRFLQRVAQFAGLALIERIRATIHYYEPFGNIGICMLEVARTLLCDPELSIPTVFGTNTVELNGANSLAV
jgi:hypothetical protein